MVFDPDSPNSYAHSKNRQPLHTDNGWFRHRRKLAFSLWKNKRLKVVSTYYSFSDIIHDLEDKNKPLLHKLTSKLVTIQKTKTEKNITKIIDLEKQKNKLELLSYKKDEEEINLVMR